MSRILSAIFPLLLSTAILLMGHGLQLTLGPLFGLKLGFSELQIGYQGSAYFLGFIIGCLGIPHLIRSVGHIRVFLVLISLATLALLTLGLGGQSLLWVSARCLSGVCFAGLYMIIESWLNESATVENRGRVLSVYSVITLIAISLGQLSISLDLGHMQLLIVGAMLILLSAIPIGLTKTPAPAPLHQVSFKFKTVYRDSKVALYSTFISGLITSGFLSLGPIIGKALGFEALEISFFLAITLVGGALFQFPVGRFSDRLDRRLVLAGLSAGASFIAFITVLFEVESAAYFYVIMFFFGAMTLPLYSISLAHANDNSKLSPVETGSVILLTYSLGSVIGPSLLSATLLVSNYGLYFIALLTLTPFAIITFLRTRTVPATQAHFMPYQDVPVTTQEAIVLSAEDAEIAHFEDNKPAPVKSTMHPESPTLDPTKVSSQNGL